MGHLAKPRDASFFRVFFNPYHYGVLTANEAKLLFQLINGRYERKSTIITTNVPLSSWGTVLHSTATAEAILDRLVYHSHVIKIKGKSYRLASVNS